MRASTALAFSAAVASAQNVGNYSSELDMKINVNDIPSQTRAVWCRAQTNTCGMLCDQNTSKNSCVQEKLEFECTCAANNSSPALQYYTQTIPTFICEHLFSQCNKEYVGNADGQQSCITNIQDLCGKSSPPKVSNDGSSGSSSSGGGSSSDSGDSSSSATGASQPSATQKSNNAVSTTTSGGLAPPTMAPAANGVAFAAALGFLALAL